MTSETTFLLACLSALDLTELVVRLDGSGDSGDAEFDHAVTSTGQTLYELPKITIEPGYPFSTNLETLVLEVASNTPDGNWYDNEGGYGTVTFYPFNDDDPVECNMTYRDEYPGEDGDDFEDEDDDLSDDEFEDAEAGQPCLPAVIYADGTEP